MGILVHTRTHTHSFSLSHTISTGIRIGPELEATQCDDGNVKNRDGCSDKCTTECGYTCSGGDEISPDICSVPCGDGLRAGAEECDDGNLKDWDGCSSSCEVEAGWTCSGRKCAISNCAVICSDGLRVGPELIQLGYCDDGNKREGDGCSKSCSEECG